MKFFTLDDTSIDIIYCDTAWIPVFVHYNWLLPLDDYIGGREKRFADDAVNNAVYGGKMYGLPYNLKGNLLYYRKDILERNGLKAARSIEEMKRQVDLIGKDEGIEHGLVYHTRYFYNDILPLIWANGGAVVNENSDLLINSKENRETLLAFKNLISAGKGYTVTPEEFTASQKSGYDWPLDEFVNGKALYMINWSNRWNKIHTRGDMEGKVGIAPIFTLDGNPGRSNYGGWYLAVNKNTSHPDECVDFLLYLLGEEQQRKRFAELSELPSLKSLYDEESRLANPDKVPLKEMYSILNNSRARIPVPSGMEIGKICDKYFTQAVTGITDIDRALEAASIDINQVLERFSERAVYEQKTEPISISSLHDYSAIPVVILAVIWLIAGLTFFLFQKNAVSLYSLKYKIILLGIATTMLSIVTGALILISMNMKMQHDELKETVAFHNRQISDSSATISKKIALAISSLLENENKKLTSLANIEIPDALADLMAVAYFDRDVRSIQVIDVNGNIIVSDKTYLFDTTFQIDDESSLVEIIERVRKIRIIASRVLPSRSGYEVLAPIYIQGTYFGAVRHVFSLDNYLERIELIKSQYQKVVLRSVIITVALVLFLGITALVVYLKFSTAITMPITALTDKAENINKINFMETAGAGHASEKSLEKVSEMLHAVASLKPSTSGKKNESATLAAAFASLAANLSSAFYLIETQNRDLENYRDHLEQMVEEKTREVQKKNNEIIDSIRYARLIQSTILTEPYRIDPHYENSFFSIWKPRDIVGGDFYWSAQTDAHHIIALGDCTGHGVPGALMTMTAASALHAIVEEDNSRPSDILYKLDENIRALLNRYSHDELVHAGLDIGLLMIDPKTGIVQFSGAGIDLYTAGKDGVQIIEGSKRSIGYKSYKPSIPYNNHIVENTKGLTLIMASDGYIHQTGGSRNFGFGRTRFMKSLEQYHTMPLKELRNILLDVFENHRSQNPQLDDVTVIGLRL